MALDSKISEDKSVLCTLLDAAKVSPSTVFEHPIDILTQSELSNADKGSILKQWKADEIALQIAESEGMGGGEPAKLDEVNQAIAIIEKTRNNC